MAHRKISKQGGAAVTDLEDKVARALLELEASVSDLKESLTDLYFVAAKEVEISAGKSAIVIFVPYRQHKKFQKIQSRLVRELEKKFPGQHVCIIAQRTILSKNYIRENKGTQIRPRSRTLTHVHSAILEDIVYPVQIVGKRTRYRFDGTKLLKIYLDPKDVKEVDYKLKTFGSVYSFITKNNVEFTFPVVEE